MKTLMDKMNNFEPVHKFLYVRTDKVLFIYQMKLGERNLHKKIGILFL